MPQAFGITREGVILDPFANEYYQNNRQSGWQLAALANDLGFDDASAHVQPDGTYHYHGVPKDLITTDRSPELIGFAGDGFPIYGPFGYSDPLDSASEVVELAPSWQLRPGVRSGGPGGFYDGTYVEDYEFIQGSGDLDECNGRFGVTHEYPSGTYYYVITNEWPYIRRASGEILLSHLKGAEDLRQDDGRLGKKLLGRLFFRGQLINTNAKHYISDNPRPRSNILSFSCHNQCRLIQLNGN